MNKVVYTVNIGHYDTTPPITPSPGWDAIYFTDDPATLPKGWTLADWTPPHQDRLLDTRHPKIMPWAYMDYDVYLYMDGRYEVVGDLNEFVATRHPGWWCQNHWTPRSVYQELNELRTKKRGYVTSDMQARIAQQQAAYRHDGVPDTQPQYPTNCCMLRSNDTQNRAISHAWWHELTTWRTWSDQVALWAVLWRTAFHVTVEPWIRWDSYLRRGMHNVKAYT